MAVDVTARAILPSVDASKLVVDFSERQRLVQKDDYDALERKYAGS